MHTLEKFLPQLCEQSRKGETCVHGKARIHARLHGMRAQGSGAEGMDRADGRPRQLRQSTSGLFLDPLPVEPLGEVSKGAIGLLARVQYARARGLCERCQAHQPGLEALPHLQRGLLGEGDGGQLPQRQSLLDDLVEDALDQQAGLSRPRPGDDHQVALVGGDRAASGFQVRLTPRLAHQSGSPCSSKYSRKGAALRTLSSLGGWALRQATTYAQ